MRARMATGPRPHTEFPNHSCLITIPLECGAAASLPASLGTVLAALKVSIDEHQGFATKFVPTEAQAYNEVYEARLVSGPHPSEVKELATAIEHYDDPNCGCVRRVALTELGERFLEAYTELDELGKPKRL